MILSELGEPLPCPSNVCGRCPPGRLKGSFLTQNVTKMAHNTDVRGAFFLDDAFEFVDDRS